MNREPREEMHEEREEFHGVDDSLESDKPRETAIPGETIKTGKDFLPGEGTRREGDKIIASRFGLVDESGRFIRVIPLSGVYIPRRGNIVIGKVVDISFNGWMIDIGGPYSSFLMVAECPRYINKNDLADFLDIGDSVACDVYSVKRRGVDLTIRGKNLGKLEGGMIIKINSNKVPRVIGKGGSMVKIIKEATNCNITVGQNGIIWISGAKIEDELLAKEAINFVVERSYISGLTEAVIEYLKGKKEKKE